MSQSCTHMKCVVSEKSFEIMFHVIRDYNGAVRILVKSNLCTFLAMLKSCVCAINVLNSFPIPFNHFDNNISIDTATPPCEDSVQEYQRVKAVCKD